MTWAMRLVRDLVATLVAFAAELADLALRAWDPRAAALASALALTVGRPPPARFPGRITPLRP
jgi:hypothetical protein